jgi:hypothetical protein
MHCLQGKKYIICFFLLVLPLIPVYPAAAEAGSGSIQFTTSSAQVKRGDIFTVVCQVSSATAFTDVSFTVDYDDSVMEFIKGGSKVSGGYGELTVDSSGNSDETYKKTFSLQFMAQGKGAGMVSVKKGTVEMTDADGNAFSTSSNALSIQVTKKGKGASASTEPESAQKSKEGDAPQSSEGAQKPAEENAPQSSDGAQKPAEGDSLPGGNVSRSAADGGIELPEEAAEEINPSATSAPSASAAEAEKRDTTKDGRNNGSIISYVLVGIIVAVMIVFLCIFSVWNTRHKSR